ncbi:MAG: hypothetical protein VZQ49_00025 [Methanobrevibacter sp.]|nr:hypothetical protein [Methanobrevibacter sp.]
MKQKRINDILYVFDITPYQITEDTEAEVIKVQEECVAGFKELNESFADKIVAYNYHVACVQVPEWAPYVDQDDSLPIEPVAGQTEWTVTLTGTGLSAETVTIKNNGETVALAESYTVGENAWFEIYPLQDPSNYTLVSENMEYDTEQGNEHWYVNPSAHGTGPIAIELNYTAQ